MRLAGEAFTVSYINDQGLTLSHAQSPGELYSLKDSVQHFMILSFWDVGFSVSLLFAYKYAF